MELNECEKLHQNTKALLHGLCWPVNEQVKGHHVITQHFVRADDVTFGSDAMAPLPNPLGSSYPGGALPAERGASTSAG